MKSKTSTGVTFRVHDVEAVRTPLETCKTRDCIEKILNNVEVLKQPPVLACSGYNSNVVNGVQYNALIAAVHTAFAEHRPLVLSPDVVWIAILQGLAQHVHLHSEELRPLLVSHTGRKLISMVLEDIEPDSPESAWNEVIESFAEAVSAHVGEVGNLLVSDFSTTSLVEKLVSQVCLLDVFEPFFEYVLYTGCGIPEITLTGKQQDWQKLRHKIDGLEPFEIDWWMPHLHGLADKFIAASQGRADQSYWQDIYKQRSNYGEDKINGWILKLFPYLKNGVTGNFDVINPIFEQVENEPGGEDNQLDRWPGATTDDIPPGLSLVPFTCFDKQQIEHKMQMIGGFVGVEQNSTTFAVQPKIGWAVRKLSSSKWEFLNDSCLEKTSPLSSEKLSAALTILQVQNRYCLELSNDFLGFYKACNGLRFQGGASSGWRVRPLELVELIEPAVEHKWSLEDSGETDPSLYEFQDSDEGIIFVNMSRYLHIFDGDDGSIAAVSTSRRKGGIFDVRLLGPDGKCRAIFSGILNFIAFLCETSEQTSN